MSGSSSFPGNDALDKKNGPSSGPPADSKTLPSAPRNLCAARLPGAPCLRERKRHALLSDLRLGGPDPLQLSAL